MSSKSPKSKKPKLLSGLNNPENVEKLLQEKEGELMKAKEIIELATRRAEQINGQIMFLQSILEELNEPAQDTQQSGEVSN